MNAFFKDDSIEDLQQKVDTFMLYDILVWLELFTVFLLSAALYNFGKVLKRRLTFGMTAAR